MRNVVDSSVAIKRVLAEVYSDKAERLRDECNFEVFAIAKRKSIAMARRDVAECLLMVACLPCER